MPIICIDFPCGSVVKNLPANAGATGDQGLISGSGRSPGGGNGSPLQYSCLGNHRGAWQAIIHGIAKESDTTSNNDNNYLHSTTLIDTVEKYKKNASAPQGICNLVTGGSFRHVKKRSSKTRHRQYIAK